MPGPITGAPLRDRPSWERRRKMAERVGQSTTEGAVTTIGPAKNSA
jgi:hypothetical protein